MESLHHLTVVLLAALTGSYIGIHLAMLIHLGIEALFLKPFKFIYKEITILGFKFCKNSDEKWERNGQNYKGTTIAEPIIDLKNISEDELKDQEKRTNTFLLITNGLFLIVSIVVFVGCLIMRSNMSLAIPRGFILFLGIAVLFMGCVRMIICVYSILHINSNTLSGYATRATNKYRAGVPLQLLDLKPEKELDFKNVKDLDRRLYFPLYFSYCDLCERFDDLADAVTEYEKIKRPDTEITVDKVTWMYLTYYFSYHNIDPSKAQMYYRRAGKVLDTDKDANGMRVKGFYHLNIMKDLDKARECLKSAEASIDTFSIPVAREEERILIARLRDAIENYKG